MSVKAENGLKIRKLVMIAMLSAVIAVCSQISIPLPIGVPVTLQTFAVALCGYLLGTKASLISVAVYISVGTVGIPVFSNFKGGIGVLFGKTGGFIAGFLLLVLFCGIGIKRKHAATAVALGLIGLAALHLLGSVWYAYLSRISLPASVLAVSVPFIIKDAVSVAFAYFFAAKLRSILKMDI